MNWFVFWIGVYLMVIVVFTIRHVKSHDLEGYLVNNRKTRTLPLVFTTLATFVGGGTSIGLMAMGYESGLAGIAIGLAYVIGFMILSRFAGNIRRTGEERKIYSFPQFLINAYHAPNDDRFDRWFSSIVSGVNIFIFFFLLSAQFVGMASLLRYAFDIGYQPAAVVSCFVVIGYTAFAGLAGVIITDSIQFIVIIGMIIVIFIPGILTDTEGLTRLSELPADMLNGTFYGLPFLVGLALFLSPSVLVRMDIFQRMLAARDAKVARRVSILSGAGMLPFYIIFPLVGMALRVVLGDSVEPREVPYLFLDRHSGEVILGFAVVGFLSALMSSGDSFLNLVSISAVKDFVGWKNRMIQNMQWRIRVTAFIFGIIAMLMALYFPRIVDLMVVGIGTIVIFVPVTFLALSRKRIGKYRWAAFYSVIAGFVVNFAFFIIGIIYPEVFEPKASFIPGFLIALITLVFLIYRTDNKRKEAWS